MIHVIPCYKCSTANLNFPVWTAMAS